MIIHNMADPESRYQEMLAQLKIRGCRITSHRLALLRLVAVSEGHPTAMQLYERLRVQFPTVSLSTIYKTLALLKEDGQVLEIDLRDDSRYDGNKPFPHPHLICTSCGRITDGDGLAALENIGQQIADQYGFRVLRQQQIFYGLCPDCQAGSS
jgi:Fur family transcriptional regulator, peroxide stress response regulator